MGKISAEFVLDTPALIGGADLGNKSELQVTGLLGMLRFWFRVRKVAEYRDTQEAFRNIEFALFGASANDQSTTRGQGAFTAWLEDAPKPSIKKLRDTDSRRKLLRFGNGYTNRPCLPAGSSFLLNILINPHAPPPDDIDAKTELVETLKVMGLVGGVGYGWRRGFGSMRLVKLKSSSAETALNASSPEDYKKALREMLVPYQDKPRVSPDMLAHFSRETAVYTKEYTKIQGDDAHTAFANAVPGTARSAAEFFSDQKGPNSRRPSPVGIHLRQCGGDTLITVTRLRPYWIGTNPDRIDDFLVSQNFTRLDVENADA